VIFLLMLFISSLYAGDTKPNLMLDSNCEKLKYNSSWSGYSKYSKYPEYLLTNTTISCRKSQIANCVVAMSGGAVSLTWSGLANSQGEATSFAKTYYATEFEVLKSFRQKVKDGKIVTVSATDDRFKAASSTDTETLAILAKVQMNSTEIIFNFDVIMAAYSYIIDEVEKGTSKDLTRTDKSGLLIRTPEDMTYSEKTSCAVMLRTKYKKQGYLTATDMNDCFAFQAYCTENLAVGGLANKSVMLQRIYDNCKAIFDKPDKYTEAQKVSCLDVINNNYAVVQTNLKYVNDLIDKFDKKKDAASAAVAIYFQDIRDKYTTLAKNMDALVKGAQTDIDLEIVKEENYGQASTMFDACSDVMSGGDEDNSFMVLMNDYMGAFSLNYIKDGVTIESKAYSTGDRDTILKKIEKAISTKDVEYATSLSKACSGITSVAKTKITESKKAFEDSKLTAEENEVFANIWNTIINKINAVCTGTDEYSSTYSIVSSDNSNSSENAVLQYLDESQELQDKNSYQDNLGPDYSQLKVQRFMAEDSKLVEANIKADLDTAEALFKGLFEPFIEYEKDGQKYYMNNPALRLLQSNAFNKRTGLGDLMKSSFRAECRKAILDVDFKFRDKGNPLLKPISALTIAQDENDFINNMKSALVQIAKDDAGICKAACVSELQPITEKDPWKLAKCGDVNAVNTGSAAASLNSSRIDLIARYMKYTPGLFKDYILKDGGAHPVLCSALLSAYHDENFTKTIEPVIGAANIVLLVVAILGSEIPYVSAGCMYGIIALSAVDFGIQMNLVTEQLSIIDFIETAANGTLIDQNNADGIISNIEDKLFYNYLSIAGDVVCIFAGAKALKIVPKVAGVEATISKALPSTIINMTPRTRLFAYLTAVYLWFTTEAIPTAAKFTSKIIPTTEKLATCGTNTIVKDGTYILGKVPANMTKLGVTTTQAEFNSLAKAVGLEESIAAEYGSKIFADASKIVTAPQTTLVAGDQIFTQIQLTNLKYLQAVGPVIKFTTNVNGYVYNNYFYNVDAVPQRYTEVVRPTDDVTAAAAGGGEPLDPETVTYVNESIADYKKYCTGT